MRSRVLAGAPVKNTSRRARQGGGYQLLLRRSDVWSSSDPPESLVSVCRPDGRTKLSLDAVDGWGTRADRGVCTTKGPSRPIPAIIPDWCGTRSARREVQGSMQ